MADELRVREQWVLEASGARPSDAPETYSYEVDIGANGRSFGWVDQSIGTGGVEALSLPPDYTTVLGFWCWFRNLDATNYVELYTATAGVAFARLYPGEQQRIRLTPTVSANIAARATSGTVRLRFKMITEI